MNEDKYSSKNDDYKSSLLEHRMEIDGRLVRVETEFSYLKKLVPTAAILVSGLVGTLLYVFFNITAENINENVQNILSQTQLETIEKEARKRTENLKKITIETTNIAEQLTTDVKVARKILESEVKILKTELSTEIEEARSISKQVKEYIHLKVKLDEQVTGLNNKLIELRKLASSISLAEERVRTGKELLGSTWLGYGGQTIWTIKFLDSTNLSYCSADGNCIKNAKWSYVNGILKIQGTVSYDGFEVPASMNAIVSRSIIVGDITEWSGSRS